MKIVHEVNGPMIYSAGGDSDLHLELFACSDARVNHPELPEYLFGDDEVIAIEGDPKFIREMIAGWLDCIDSVIKHREEIGVAQQDRASAS